MSSRKKGEIWSRFILLAIFAAAMGILEAAAVVYLRSFAEVLEAAGGKTAAEAYLRPIEIPREASTMVMLLTLGIIAGKNFLQRFSYFIYIFGIWDIFYYVGFKVFVGWPSSLLTWDCLFLIPSPWYAPVLYPIICSLIMISLGVEIVYLQGKNYSLKINWSEWGLLLLGGLVILSTFLWDYSVWAPFQTESLPEYYNWCLFGIGASIIIFGEIFLWRKER